jgi:hypothetical protein
MAPSAAWQTLMRERGAELEQDSFRELFRPEAQAESHYVADCCCFDPPTVTETLVLHIIFVK